MASIAHHDAPPAYAQGPGYIMRNMDSTRDFRSIDMAGPDAAAMRSHAAASAYDAHRTTTNTSDDERLPGADETQDNRPLMHDASGKEVEETDYKPVDWKNLHKKFLTPKYIREPELRPNPLLRCTARLTTSIAPQLSGFCLPLAV